MSGYGAIAARLAESVNPIARYKARVRVLGQGADDPNVRRARREIRSHPVVTAMLDDVAVDAPAGRAGFSGTYMTLKHLADVEYPAGDRSLNPYRDHVYAWLRSAEAKWDELCIRDKYRVHGSFHGNAIYASVALGIANRETDRLQQKLMQYRWPGGGWNCSKVPKAQGPTLVHTAYGLRGLLAYRTRKPSAELDEAIEECIEVLLARHVHRGRRNRATLSRAFEKLTYPYPRLYNFMAGLHILARAGRADDPRCEEALDLLEAKCIEGEGWAMERKEFHHIRARGKDYTGACWEKELQGKAHLLLTADALEILACAGRM